MSLYYETLYAWKCKGTHHKLAMDALPLLAIEDAEDWSNLYLRHIESYLTGSKDPDAKFKDFRNHVLHVGDNFWGGAVKATQEWYGKARQAFADGLWREGVYASGVMSHYLTDIFCPLHTGQSEKENVIHRACEWSVSCSYDDLLDDLLETHGGFPEIKLPTGDDWLKQLLHAEATHANFLYYNLVDGYNFDDGVKDPPAGLDETLAKEMSLTLGRACVCLAAVLDRCLQESGQKPPYVSLSLHALLSQVTIPVFWITQKMANAEERKIVTRIYEELQRTGKVEENLPEENRVIRDLVQKYRNGEEDTEAVVPAAAPASSHKKQKPKITVTAQTQKSTTAPVADPFLAEATANEQDPMGDDHFAPEEEVPIRSYETAPAGKGTRCYLRFDSPIVDAPSIGPKTAARFQKINLPQVHDLLTTEARTIAQKLNTQWITLELVQAWQQQAELMCSVPGLRGHDAQLLQGVGVQNYLDLANSRAEDLQWMVEEFASTTEGQRILRSSQPPDLKEVHFWIENARQAMQNQAA